MAQGDVTGDRVILARFSHCFSSSDRRGCVRADFLTPTTAQTRHWAAYFTDRQTDRYCFTSPENGVQVTSKRRYSFRDIYGVLPQKSVLTQKLWNRQMAFIHFLRILFRKDAYL